MPYLHWERSLSRIHASSIYKDSRKFAQDIFQRHGRKALKYQEISELPCTKFEKIVRYCSLGKPFLLLRQTLDQYYYQDLASTEIRDRDQVVERYSRQHGWQKHSHRVLMVDELWLWIVDNSKDHA